MLSFDQFRSAIEARLAELEAIASPSAEDLEAIATLTTLLAGLPAEAIDS